MAKLKTILSKICALQMEIETPIKATSFEDNKNLSSLHINDTNSNQLFLLDELLVHRR